MRYVGQAPGERSWLGPKTFTRYPFIRGQVRWVDCRDAEYWLKPLRGEGKAFEEVSE